MPVAPNLVTAPPVVRVAHFITSQTNPKRPPNQRQLLKAVVKAEAPARGGPLVFVLCLPRTHCSPQPRLRDGFDQTDVKGGGTDGRAGGRGYENTPVPLEVCDRVLKEWGEPRNGAAPGRGDQIFAPSLMSAMYRS